jgi:predicted nucleotidyltransferase
MAKTTIEKEIIDSVQKYRKVIEDSGISVDKMIIFGSRAKGNSTSRSDIDVAVVSKEFGLDDVDEMQNLWKKTRFADNRIEPYPLSIHEYEHGFSPIVSEIRKYGILVV